MKALLLPVAALLLPRALACDNPDSDACAAAFTSSAAQLATFCATFTASTVTATTGWPSGIASACETKTKKVSSACSCFVTGSGSGSGTTSTTLTTSTKTSTTSKATSTTAGSGGGTTCTVTAYASISSAVKSCTNIVLSNISAPPSSTIDLQKLQTGAAVTFAGDTTFGYTPDDGFDPIVISGTDVLITGAPGHVIDGNGPAYWDGQGSNGGTSKPDHFIVVKDSTNLQITNLNIKNWPVHCFDMTNNEHLTVTGLTMDNSAGDAPNAASSGLPAAHNSDGFDISSSDYVTLNSISVHNQDDCVAVTSGTQITVTNMYCYGGHGLSIGSIGGKSNNTVNGVTFSNSQVVNSQNGCRIKTNSGTTGTVNNVVYQNIAVSGITVYGIDVQQDYLNGGPTGTPTNGVIVSDISFINVTGTATSSALDYYILCGSGSCSGFTFSDVDITGGSTGSCNYPSSGCP